MAESGSETEMERVKEGHGGGQQLLQTLYSELDKEREASATAASEALSMILRLQGEKAALKMEASQYQRMAEEKLCHTQEYLAGFEDMIYQKEMEIASLEFQVQAYRYKLLSLDCPDLGSCEPRFADKFLLQNKDLVTKGVTNGEIGVSGYVRRAQSLPLTQLDELYYRKSVAEMERFEILTPDSCPSIVERSNCCSSKPIEMLDEQIKEISDSKGSGEDRSKSLNGGSVVCHSRIQDHPDVVSPKSCGLSTVQDIFEIPEANQACQTRIKPQEKSIFEGENRLGKPDPVLIEPFKQHHKDVEQTRTKKASSCKSQKNKSSKVRKVKAVGSSTIPVQEQIDEIVAESQPFQQLCRATYQLEQNIDSIRQEISSAKVEEMKLLKEIQEQLNSIQSEMRSLKTEQRPKPDNSMFDLLQEAMVYFWF